jgi:crotonobetainyl-CoA:carnitine CoA-transferase CaiB-like acyl-CoA transferase
VPRGCELPPFAPHGVYRTADDHWVAVAVQSDDEWTQLLAGLADPPSLMRPGWERANGRFAARSGVDDALSELIGERDRDDVLRALTAVGTRCTEVLDGAALVADAHLQSRGFFPRVVHPDPELREARVVGVAWRFAGEGPIALGPPPALASTPADTFEGATP